MRKFLLGCALLGAVGAAPADNAWFCKEGASERISNTILACGIARAKDEDDARKAALRNAFDELDLVCDRSADCRRFNLNIEPKRNECSAEAGGYKCYRAVLATITGERRTEDFRRGETLKGAMARIDSAPPPRGCPHDLAAIENRMRDLSDASRIEALVAAATPVPFAGECAALHFKVLARLEGFRLANASYEQFVIEWLGKPEVPGHEDRLYAALGWFRALGALTETQWAAVFAGLRHASSGHYYRLLPKAFDANASTESGLTVERRRLDQLVAALRDGGLGKPVALSFDKGFALLLDGLSRSRLRENSALALHLLDQHFASTGGTEFKAVHDDLFTLYRAANAPADRARFIHFLSQNTARATASTEIARKVVDVTEWFNREIEKLDDEEAADRARMVTLRADRDAYLNGARERIEQALVIAPGGRYEVRNRIVFCASHGFACHGLMPSMEEFRRQLRSKQESKRIETLEMLKAMPATARQLEAEITQTLLDVHDREQNFTAQLGRAAHAVLIAIPVSHPKALDAILADMLAGMTNYEDVLKKIGPRLVTRIMAVVADRTSRHRLLAIRFLGLIGPPAREAVVLLERELKQDNHYSIRDALQESLAKIRK